MNTSTSIDTLQEAMTKVESVLLTPQVSGELDRWVDALRLASTDLFEEVKRFVKRVSETEYAKIADADAELLPRVQRMRDDDEKLVADLESFCGNVGVLAQRAALAASDESKTNEHRAVLEAQGHDLILRIKKQQSAASTWLTEALNRDRGVSG